MHILHHLSPPLSLFLSDATCQRALTRRQTPNCVSRAMLSFLSTMPCQLPIYAPLDHLLADDGPSTGASASVSSNWPRWLSLVLCGTARKGIVHQWSPLIAPWHLSHPSFIMKGCSYFWTPCQGSSTWAAAMNDAMIEHHSRRRRRCVSWQHVLWPMAEMTAPLAARALTFLIEKSVITLR